MYLAIDLHKHGIIVYENFSRIPHTIRHIWMVV
jgi:hypothetical protein